MREDSVTSPKLGTDHDVWVMEVPTWVNIIPITPQREVVMVNQYRFGSEKASLEIPGGMADFGEDPKEAAIRELKEELAIETEASCFAPFTFTSHSYEEFNLLLALFLCRKWNGMVTPLESQVIKWVKPKSLKNFEMPPADKPLIAMLRDFL